MSILSDAFDQLTGGSQENQTTTTTSSTTIDPEYLKKFTDIYDKLGKPMLTNPYFDFSKIPGVTTNTDGTLTGTPTGGQYLYGDPTSGQSAVTSGLQNLGTDFLGAGFTPPNADGTPGTPATVTLPDGTSAPAPGYMGTGMNYFTEVGAGSAPTVGSGQSFMTDPETGVVSEVGPGIENYMNPYTEQVIDAAGQDYQDALKLGRQAVGQAAMGSNAFGSERQGIAEGTMASKAMDDYLNRMANLRAAGYTDARNFKERDIDRGMRSDALTGNLSLGFDRNKLGAGSSLTDPTGQINLLNAIGGNENNLYNLGLNKRMFGYNEGNPVNVMNNLGGFLNTMPYNTTTTGTSTSPMYRKSPFMNMMGLGLAGLGGYGMYKNAFGN